MTARSHRIVAAGLLAAGVLAGIVTVAEVASGIVRADLLFLVVVFGVSGVGLWIGRSWARWLAILVCLWNAGLGSLALVASLIGGSGIVAPLLFVGLNVAAIAAVSRGRGPGG